LLIYLGLNFNSDQFNHLIFFHQHRRHPNSLDITFYV
jgi:hypothetical protein